MLDACALAFADPDPLEYADDLLELFADARPPLVCALDRASEVALLPPDAIALEDASAVEPAG